VSISSSRRENPPLFSRTNEGPSRESRDPSETARAAAAIETATAEVAKARARVEYEALALHRSHRFQASARASVPGRKNEAGEGRAAGLPPDYFPPTFPYYASARERGLTACRSLRNKPHR